MPVVRAEGTLRPGEGPERPASCAVSPAPWKPFYYGGLDTRGEAVVGISVDGVITELARAALPAEVASAARHRVAVECAVTGPDADRVVVWVDGIPVLDHFTTRIAVRVRPCGGLRGGDGKRFDVAFDDVVLSGGLAYAPSSAPPTTE